MCVCDGGFSPPPFPPPAKESKKSIEKLSFCERREILNVEGFNSKLKLY